MTRRQGHDLIRAREVSAERARQRRIEQEQIAAQVRQIRAQRRPEQEQIAAQVRGPARLAQRRVPRYLRRRAPSWLSENVSLAVDEFVRQRDAYGPRACDVPACTASWAHVRKLSDHDLLAGEGLVTTAYFLCKRHMRMSREQLLQEAPTGRTVELKGNGMGTE